MEMIDDEAAEYGIRFVKINDKLMAKKYGFRDPPGLAYFRKGKHIKFDGRYCGGESMGAQKMHSELSVTYRLPCGV